MKFFFKRAFTRGPQHQKETRRFFRFGRVTHPWKRNSSEEYLYFTNHRNHCWVPVNEECVTIERLQLVPWHPEPGKLVENNYFMWQKHRHSRRNESTRGQCVKAIGWLSKASCLIIRLRTFPGIMLGNEIEFLVIENRTSRFSGF